MLVRYWQPLREFETLRQQMDRVFDELTQATSGETTAWAPAIELKENGDALVLRAQLPGIEAKDLDVQVTREAVAISGEYRSEAKESGKGFLRSEFRYGKFNRVIPLPVAVENDQVTADFKDGILSLTLPKVKEARNRVVKLNLVGEEKSEEKAIEAEAQES